MNKIIIIGNLGRDPEYRYTANGNPMASFSIAENRRYTTSDGEQRQATEWFQCTAFGRLADVCNQYLKRGQQVYIEGRLSSRRYQQRDGTDGFSLDVMVTEMQMLGQRDGADDKSYGGSDRGSGQRQGSGARSTAPPARNGPSSAAAAAGSDMDVDDLPF